MPHSTSPIGTDMQDRASELRRIPLPRTWVNSVHRLVAYGPGDVFSRISRSTEVRGEEGGDLVLRWVPDLPGGGEDLARDSRGTGRRRGGQAGRGQHRRGGPSAPLCG